VAVAAATLMMLNLESADSDELDKGGYTAWIWNSLFRRRCNADPNLLDEIATCIRLHLSQIPERSDPKERPLVTAAILRIIAKFPEPLKVRLQAQIGEISEFGKGMRRVLKAAELEFDAATYITQVASALANGSARVESLRPKEEVTIRRVPTSNWDAIDVERPLMRIAYRFRNHLWGALLESSAARESALRGHRQLFDGGQKEFERLLESIANSETRSPGLRRLPQPREVACLSSTTACSSESRSTSL
jgi:hypothetical protein